jgi:hypothetical protein
MSKKKNRLELQKQCDKKKQRRRRLTITKAEVLEAFTASSTQTIINNTTYLLLQEGGSRSILQRTIQIHHRRHFVCPDAAKNDKRVLPRVSAATNQNLCSI